MANIEKKIWPESFDLILKGKKKFEFRLADFEINSGDTLILKEWDPKTKDYTGRQIEKEVTYMIKLDLDTFGQKEELEKNGAYILQFE